MNAGAHPTDAYSVHEMAAHADPAAFATLCCWHQERARLGIEPPPIALARASDYARLAAIARGAPDDWLTLLTVLDQYAAALRAEGHTVLADHATAEAVTLVELMAEDGDENAATAIAIGAADISPGALTLARGMRESLKGLIGC